MATDTKAFWRSRTFWFNIVTIALGTFELVTKQWSIPGEYIVLVIGIGNLILRTLTTQPLGWVGKKKK